MGLAVDRVSEEATIRRTVEELEAGRGGWICTANLDILRQVVKKPPLRKLVDEADLVVADGMPIVWASRLQGRAVPERVAGSSLMTTLPPAAAEAGASIFLLGGNPGMADLAAERLVAASPSLEVSGTHCPPFGYERSPAALAAIEAAVTAAQPDIVFVALPFPKQEELIARLRPLLPQAWFIGVGVSFSFLAGEVQRAPRWLQRIGLEWAHRLTQEPGRLARRYLVDGIPFGVRLLADAAARRIRVGRTALP
jgi:N-acetylglucosaminyldiphosphoundecaprenol N-acetyl-beta-D-mannosaminyltransferase